MDFDARSQWRYIDPAVACSQSAAAGGNNEERAGSVPVFVRRGRGELVEDAGNTNSRYLRVGVCARPPIRRLPGSRHRIWAQLPWRLTTRMAAIPPSSPPA